MNRTLTGSPGQEERKHSKKDMIAEDILLPVWVMATKRNTMLLRAVMKTLNMLLLATFTIEVKVSRPTWRRFHGGVLLNETKYMLDVFTISKVSTEWRIVSMIGMMHTRLNTIS